MSVSDGYFVKFLHKQEVTGKMLNDTFATTSIKEDLFIIWEFNELVPFNPDTNVATSSSYQKFYNTLNLKNTIYHNVYELTNPDANPVTKLRSIYFSFEYGVVGFFLINKELYVRL